MTWAARAQLYHDPLQVEYLPGDAVPDSVIEASPWLVDSCLVVPAKKSAAKAQDSQPDISAAPAVEEG